MLVGLERAFVAGRSTVDALVRAIPDHPQPLSAILSLADAGWLEMDLAAAFDADTRVRLTGRRAV